MKERFQRIVRVVDIAWAACRLVAITVWATVTANRKLLGGGLLFTWLLILVFPIVAPFPSTGKILARVVAGPMLRVFGMGKRIEHNFHILFGPSHGYDTKQVGRHIAGEYIDLAANKSRSDRDLLSEYHRDESVGLFAEDWHKNHLSVLVSVHFGAPQAAVRVLPILGVRLYVPTEPLRVREQSRFTNWLREPPGCKFERISGKTVEKACDYLLSENPLMPGFLFDRVPRGKGKIYKFLGGYNEFATSPAEVALRTGAKLYFGVAVDTSGEKATIYIDGPIVPRITGDHSLDVDYIMCELIWRYEEWVQAYPEQLIGAGQMHILTEEEARERLHDEHT